METNTSTIFEELDKKDRSPKEQIAFLLQDGNMNRLYLSSCLDSCRWGSITSCMWEMSLNEMISFIQNWIQQNESNFLNLFQQGDVSKIKLPYISHGSCPRNSEDDPHIKRIRDLKGRIRCAHKTKEKLTPGYDVSYPSYFDEHIGMRRIIHFDNEPNHPEDCLPCDAWDEDGNLLEIYKEDFENQLKEFEKYKEKLRERDNKIVVIDLCYAILSDEGTILPLETILKRKNLAPLSYTIYCGGEFWNRPCKRLEELTTEELYRYFYIQLEKRCMGHNQEYDKVAFQLDGWGLASYVQKWLEQLPEDQFPPWFET